MWNWQEFSGGCVGIVQQVLIDKQNCKPEKSPFNIVFAVPFTRKLEPHLKSIPNIAQIIVAIIISELKALPVRPIVGTNIPIAPKSR